jgi:hypothetical protein
MHFGITLPSDFVLKLLVAPKVPHVDDAFDLVFLFSFDQIRWRFREVRAMLFRFLIWR